MKKLFSKVLNRLRQPKWRHGKLNTLLMFLILAACVLVNIGVKSLETAYGWKQDLSFNGYASAGDETKAILDSLQVDVEIYPLYQSDEENLQLLELLQTYQSMSSHIKVIPTDLSLNPAIVSRFEGSVDQSVEAGAVIVFCPATNRYQLLGNSDLYAQSLNLTTGEYEWTDLAYEKKITETILYVTQEAVPTIGFLQGHGELTEEEQEQFLSFLKGKNYQCDIVNLISGDTLENIDLLVISAPQKDFSDEEVENMKAYAKEGGNFFIMRSFTDPVEDMPNYLAFLRNYGIVPIPGIVSETEEDSGSYYGNVFRILPYMQEMDLTLQLIVNQLDVLLLDYPCAFAISSDTDTSLSVGAVLKTGENAYVISNPQDENAYAKTENSIQGALNLAVYAQRMHANGNISRLYINGNCSLFTDEFIYQRTYNDTYIEALLDELLAEKSTSLDISTSAVYRQELTVGSQTLAIPLLIALPVLILILALAILLPRANR